MLYWSLCSWTPPDFAVLHTGVNLEETHDLSVCRRRAGAPLWWAHSAKLSNKSVRIPTWPCQRAGRETCGREAGWAGGVGQARFECLPFELILVDLLQQWLKNFLFSLPWSIPWWVCACYFLMKPFSQPVVLGVVNGGERGYFFGSRSGFLFLGGSQCHAGAFSCLRTVCATFLALSSAGLFSQQIKIVSGYNRWLKKALSYKSHSWIFLSFPGSHVEVDLRSVLLWL